MTPPCLLLYFFLLGCLHIIVVCGHFICIGCVSWDSVVDDAVKKNKGCGGRGISAQSGRWQLRFVFYVGQDKSLCFYVEDKHKLGLN
jgi:hypothetical protein